MIHDRARRRYWQAGLLAFILSPLVFFALPLGDMVPVRAQVAILLAVQATAVLAALIWVRGASRRTELPFDLRPRPGNRRSQRTPRRIDQFLDG